MIAHALPFFAEWVARIASAPGAPIGLWMSLQEHAHRQFAMHAALTRVIIVEHIKLADGLRMYAQRFLLGDQFNPRAMGKRMR